MRAAHRIRRVNYVLSRAADAQECIIYWRQQRKRRCSTVWLEYTVHLAAGGLTLQSLKSSEQLQNPACGWADNHRAVVAGTHAGFCGLQKTETRLFFCHNLRFIFNIMSSGHFYDRLQFIASLFPNTIFLFDSLNFHIFSLFLLEVKCAGCVTHVIRFTLAEAFIARPRFALRVRRVPAKQPLFISIYFDQRWSCGNTASKTAHLFDMKADDY